MAQDEKRQPTSTPPPTSLRDRLSAAISDEASRRQIVVRMTVRGGLPSQRYRFEFEAKGDGSAACRLEDQLKKRPIAEGKAKRALEDREFVALLRRLEPALARPRETPLFLPDTLVGILDVSDGSSIERLYFAADPEQARAQNKVPEPALQQAIDAVYAAGASLSGVRNVKP
jgi:hypothetical protein